MSVEYNDLEHLLFQNVDARQYYNELPEYVRDKINSQPNHINSYESLQDYAENLLKGDS